MSQVKFIQISRASFNSLAPKDPNTLYFVFDSATDSIGDLYRGSIKMSYPAQVVESLPTENILKNTIYVDVVAGESKLYDGSKWIGIGPKIVASSVTSAEGYAWSGDTADDSSVPTVKAVGEFVTEAIKGVTGGGVVKSVSKSTTDGKALTVNQDGVTSDIILDGLVTDLTYESTTGKLILTKTVGGVATPMTAVNLPLEQALTGVAQHTVTADEAGQGIYADATEGEVGLLLTVSNLSDSTTVQYWVSLQGFVDDHNVIADNAEGAVVSIAVSEATVVDGVLTWKVSATFDAANLADGAIAQSKINGLADALAGKMALVAGATADNLLSVNADGQAVDSGIAKSSLVTKVVGTENTLFVNDGTGALKATTVVIGSDATDVATFGAANTVATEAATKNYVDSALTWTVIA